jgi:hypothetical protein
MSTCNTEMSKQAKHIDSPPIAQESPVGQGLLIMASQSHSDTPHSVGQLWTSYQPIAETSTWQHTTPARDRHTCLLWDMNPQSQQASSHRPMQAKNIHNIKYLRRLGTLFTESQSKCSFTWHICNISHAGQWQSLTLCNWTLQPEKNVYLHEATSAHAVIDKLPLCLKNVSWVAVMHYQPNHQMKGNYVNV